MSWTKRQFINQAYNEIGLANYVFDLSPEQINTALFTLDAMMASWNAKGIRVGFPLPSSPEASTIESETNVPDAANEAIYLNLALRLAAPVGKAVQPQTERAAYEAYNALLSKVVSPGVLKPDGYMPYGAGYKRMRKFMPAPQSDISVGMDSILELE